MVRTALEAGAAKTNAAWLIFAFIAPAALARSTSRDSRSASFLTSSAASAAPSMTPPLMTSAGFALAKSRSPFAASTMSPWTNATAVGPVNCPSRESRPASFAAMADADPEQQQHEHRGDSGAGAEDREAVGDNNESAQRRDGEIDVEFDHVLPRSVGGI